MKHHVYCITHVASGLKYVGVTNNVQLRWYGHRSDAARGKAGAIAAAIRSHGVDAFTVETLVTCDERGAALEAEVEWIERLGTRDPAKGYNVARGQTGGPSVVYRVRCNVDGRVYVGVSRDMAKRWKAHVEAARRGSPLPLHCALRQYGLDAFEVSELERAETRSAAEAAEVSWIEKLRSNDPRIGYNRTGRGIRKVVADDELERLIREQAADAKSTQVRPHVPSAFAQVDTSVSEAEHAHAAEHLDQILAE